MKCLLCGEIFRGEQERYDLWREGDSICWVCGERNKLIPTIRQNCRISKKGAKETLALLVGAKHENKLQKKEILGNKDASKKTK